MTKKKEEREYAKNREEYFREFHSVVAPVVVLKSDDYDTVDFCISCDILHIKIRSLLSK